MVNSYWVEVKPDFRLHGLPLQVGVHLVRDTRGQLVIRAVPLIVHAGCYAKQVPSLDFSYGVGPSMRRRFSS